MDSSRVEFCCLPLGGAFFFGLPDYLCPICRSASRCPPLPAERPPRRPVRSPPTRAGKQDDVRMHKANSLKLIKRR